MSYRSPLVLKTHQPSMAAFHSMEWTSFRGGFDSAATFANRDGVVIPMFTIRCHMEPRPFTELVINTTGEELKMPNVVMAKSYAAAIYSNVDKCRSKRKCLYTERFREKQRERRKKSEDKRENCQPSRRPSQKKWGEGNA